MTEVPPDFFSWKEAPLQASVKSAGSTSAAMRSTSAMASPELTPGLPLPIIFTAGRLSKRSRVPGPVEYSIFASARSGTISPLSLRT